MSDRTDAGELLALAVQAATRAGALLAGRARHGAERDVSAKSTPTDLVSEADLISERTIRELLAERRPHDGFVGEEGDDIEGSSGLRWIVDPLDGTINFLFGIPQWSVSVAVRDHDGTVAGAVYDPNRDELWSATRDGPATLTDRHGTVALEGHRAARTGDGSLATAMVATGLAYDAQVRAAQGRVLARVVPRVRDIRRFGSAALDLTWTAAGRYDAYFERSVKQWDIAAGALVCERVGLRVFELPVHEHLPWGILVAREGLAEELLELVEGP
ncbi:MAG TPA: inositol monophosphatase family protein [Solirubrobacteraceae bacterium]|nr:inositol monophosphatase family protein [Solirubrobacteraceae bacterium]